MTRMRRNESDWSTLPLLERQLQRITRKAMAHGLDSLSSYERALYDSDRVRRDAAVEPLKPGHQLPLTLELPWPPSMNRYWRNVDGTVKISAEGRRYRREVLQIVGTMRVQMVTCRLSVRIKAYPPDARRRDIDNMLKATLDALEHANVYESDWQIDALSIVRGEKMDGGKMTVRIDQMAGPRPEVEPW